MARVIVRNVMVGVTVDTTTVVETQNLSNIGIVVIYDRTDTDGEGTLTITGCDDTSHTNEYIPAIKPTLTGTIDADGAFAYTTDTTVYYNVDGVHQFLKFYWNETVSTTAMTVYVVGLERE